MEKLAGIQVPSKTVRRITSQIGADRCAERSSQVEAFREMPLMGRSRPNATATVPELGVVMMDGGRHQRRDHFGQPAADRQTHWKENKVGLVLSMESETFDSDPCPELPEWLVGAAAISELAKLAEPESVGGASKGEANENDAEDQAENPWPDAPQLVAREMIASLAACEPFGWHLESEAWRHGIPAAKRKAFVADGAAVNWTIHRKHFSEMTPVLDLMHALSYAHQAAVAIADPTAYRRYAEWIWKGKVERVIVELQGHQLRLGMPPPDAPDTDPRKRIERTLTYYRNQQERMNYPEYRRNGLPLTSSHIESAVKQINFRIKGTEKFWAQENAESILQLRADELSDSQPLQSFWFRWRANITGANRYRNIAA